MANSKPTLGSGHAEDVIGVPVWDPATVDDAGTSMGSVAVAEIQGTIDGTGTADCAMTTL